MDAATWTGTSILRATLYSCRRRARSTSVYQEIEPVAVVPLSNTEGVRRALEETIARGAVARGNPSASMLPRGQWPPPVVLKYAGVKSWSTFEHDMSLWGLEEKGGAFSIIGKRKKPDGALVDGPEQTIKFAPGTRVEHVIDRVAAILQAAACKKIVFACNGAINES